MRGRFTELMLLHKRPESVVTFGGDLFSPSLLAAITRGEHMVPFVNALGVGAACVGNHDCDHGNAQF